MRIAMLQIATVKGTTPHIVDSAYSHYIRGRKTSARSLIKAVLAAGIALAAAAAQAEPQVIATKAINIDQSHDLMITLRDGTGGQCGDLHTALLTITGGPTFAIPYGDGCWYITKGGMVVIEGQSFSSGQTMQLEHDADSFETSRNFTQWSDYANQFNDGY